MKTIILIDGSNFMFKCFWGHKLSSNGKNIQVVYAAFKNTLWLIKKIKKDLNTENVDVVFCWDRGYTKRFQYSKQAVMDGIINITYKGKRRVDNFIKNKYADEEEVVEKEDLNRQIAVFQEMLNKTSIQQRFSKGDEADDVIATYATKYGKENKIIIVSSDQDYHQLLTENVVIFNSHKNKYKNLKTMKEEDGFDTTQSYIEIAGLMGDKGDSILGVPGWGQVTAKKYIYQFKTTDAIIKDIKSKGKTFLDRFCSVKEMKKSVDEGLKHPWNAKEYQLILHEKRVAVAKHLKKMYCDLDLEPLLKPITKDNELVELFKQNNFQSMLNDLHHIQNEPIDESKVNRVLNLFKTKIAKCPKCDQEFMSKNSNIECPECNVATITKPKTTIVQPSLF